MEKDDTPASPDESTEGGDSTPPGVGVRELTPEEKVRMKEALTKLHAPWKPGEPSDPDAVNESRLAALRLEYPDVADLIGCAETTAP
jgi:hypothetical protein